MASMSELPHAEAEAACALSVAPEQFKHRPAYAQSIDSRQAGKCARLAAWARNAGPEPHMSCLCLAKQQPGWLRW